jgi:hypothetical protein
VKETRICPLCEDDLEYRIGAEVMPAPNHEKPGSCEEQTVARIRKLLALVASKDRKIDELQKQLGHGQAALRGQDKWRAQVQRRAREASTNEQLAERLLLQVAAGALEIDAIDFETTPTGVTTLLQVTERGVVSGEVVDPRLLKSVDLAQQLSMEWARRAESLAEAAAQSKAARDGSLHSVPPP